MKNFVISAVYVAVFAGIVLLLSPKGKGGSMESHIKLLVSLAFISVIIQPAVSFFKTLEIPDFNIKTVASYAYEEELYENLLTLEKSELEKRLKTLIAQNFSINEENVDVTVTVMLQDDVPKTEKVFVKVSGRAIFCNTNDIEDYVSALLGCKCTCFV